MSGLWNFRPRRYDCPEARKLLRYYITDRRSLNGADGLIQNIERLGCGIDFVQVREKDLEAFALALLVRRVMRAAHPAVRILVNSRADVAIACAAHGVHLPSGSFSARSLRKIAPPGFVISVACHSLPEVAEAEAEGADYALLSPIYPVAGKAPALGIGALKKAALRRSIPVLALGGVRPHLISECEAAGAAGIAAIRLFQDSDARSGFGVARERDK